MPVLVDRLFERVDDGGGNTEPAVLAYAQPRGYLIRGQKAHAVHLFHEAVRIGLDRLLRVRAVDLIYPDGDVQPDVQFLQKEYRVLHIAQIMERGVDLHRLFQRDALDAHEGGGIVFDDFERVRAENVHDGARGHLAHALEKSAREIFDNALFRSGLGYAHLFGGELLAELPVEHISALDDQFLALGHGRKFTDSG